MASDIGEPFLLSKYGVKTQATFPVSVTSVREGSSSVRHAAVTAQGDGIHILDTNSLASVATHTLGPATTFSCPAVSTFSAQEFTTYAAIASSSDLPQGSGDRTIWILNEKVTGPLSERAAQKKRAVSLPHSIHELHTTTSGLIAISNSGDISFLAQDGALKGTHSDEGSSIVVKNFVFPSKLATFLPSHRTTPLNTVLVQIISANKACYARVHLILEDGTVSIIAEPALPVDPTRMIGTSLSASGDLSVLLADGSWSLFKLESPDDTTVELNIASDSLCLSSLSFDTSSSEASILSCTSTLVLFAGISKSPREIVLILWDLQYSVVLASQTLPLPSQSSSNNEPVALQLLPASSSHVFLVISPTPRKRSNGGALKSSVFLVPVTAGKSTIANAMGCASAGAQWVAAEDVSSSKHSSTQIELLASIQKSIEAGRPEAASKTFLAWIAKATETSEEKNLPLEYSFVRDILAIVLQPTITASNAIYPSDIIHQLLDRRAISAGMVPTGLLRCLRARHDWPSLQNAFLTVNDLSEVEIIENLAYVVANAKKSGSPDAMQVDGDASTTTVPTIVSFLSSCVKYATSPAPLRLAIRRYLSDPSDTVAILQVLENWMAVWKAKESRLIPSKKTLGKNEHGAVVLVVSQDEKVIGDLPLLSQVVQFTETVLDATFLGLVQDADAHRVLRKIQAHIEPQTAMFETTERLRAPLLPFVKMHAKTLREAREAKEFPDAKKAALPDWRQRRKQAHEQAGMTIQLYQLEELIL